MTTEYERCYIFARCPDGYVYLMQGLITVEDLQSEQCRERLIDQGGIPDTQFIVTEAEMNARPELLEARKSWYHFIDQQMKKEA